MTDDGVRRLTNARARRFLLAIQDVMGQSGLVTVLRQTGLQRYAASLPPANREPGLQASEYAAIMQAIENYYGRGARGTLTRIGGAAFSRLLEHRPFTVGVLKLARRVLPLQMRRVWVLRWLARDMAGHNGQVSVHQDDRHLEFVDHVSDSTAGRKRDSEICWVTLGTIQEALRWGTRSEFDIAEVSCRAKGDAACRFHIGDAH